MFGIGLTYKIDRLLRRLQDLEQTVDSEKLHLGYYTDKSGKLRNSYSEGGLLQKLETLTAIVEKQNGLLAEVIDYVYSEEK